MNPYSPRIVDAELDELTAQLPAISIEGPKGVGKTVTAARRASTVHDLDEPASLNFASGDPARLLLGSPPVLIDEWQHIPSVWNLVRRAVDAGAAAGTFLLTGSASPPSVGLHSGAGRIVTVRMRPLTLPERGFATPTVSLGQLLTGQRPTLTGASSAGLEDYVNEILRSGLPGIRGLSDRGLRTQLDSYLTRVVDRDIEMEAGRRVRNPQRVRRWMEAYAAATATTASFETIRAAASDARGRTAAKSTAIPYRDALERLWITDPLPAWTASRNRLGRVGLPPKHHLADPALAARLLGVGADALLHGASAGPKVPRDGTLVGALFESLVTLGVRVFAQHSEARVGHLRTWSGDREVDLIVERDDGRVLAIEVKLSRTVDDAHVRNLVWLRDKIGPDLLDAIVITTGPDAYRRRDGIGVVPAALLGP